ncbi:hypothetical protein ABH908_002756 [Pseudomonas frederiksbergensis]|uniref:hypothetical protein n=1 Tax=Pseudomonas TaxID=286 RepID=UPI00143DE567|nr:MULTISPECIES: hypothetical protein [unclassified Pseudomonas]MBD9615718.1 hypothetical protein [Pseudomonas sp. PDM07]WLG42699.1 hypothetical protein PSH69_17500 [Pseudomonas sp. FP1740]
MSTCGKKGIGDFSAAHPTGDQRNHQSGQHRTTEFRFSIFDGLWHGTLGIQQERKLASGMNHGANLDEPGSVAGERPMKAVPMPIVAQTT